MPDDCLEVFRLHPARIAQVYLVVETDPRDDSIAVQKAEDVLRVRTARVSDVEAKVLISNKTRKLRDRCGLIVVGAFVHDLRTCSFRETDEAQISVFDCGREFGPLVDDERADVLECLGATKSGWRMRDTQDNELLSDIPVPSNASDRVPRPGPCDRLGCAARARPDAPRPPKPGPHRQAGRRRLPPESRTGTAPRGRGGRPADRRARAVPGARLRRARRDLSFGPRRPARTRGDGLAFASGVYLYTACCVVASEFYASGMAKMAEREGHAVDRAWVALRLAHFVAARRRGRVALRAAGCAALAALMLRGIAEHYRYYGLLPRLQQVTICLCALCLFGEALARGREAGGLPRGPGGGCRIGEAGPAPGPAQAPLRRRRGRLDQRPLGPGGRVGVRHPLAGGRELACREPPLVPLGVPPPAAHARGERSVHVG